MAELPQTSGTVAGGHTIRSEEPIFGLAVQGPLEPIPEAPLDKIVTFVPVGPAITAVLYGAVPAAVVVLAREEIFRAAAEIRDWDWLYPQPLVNLPLYGFVLFPTIAALLLGTAIASAGRWR
mgnify:CR=1 FL=1